MSEPEVLGIDLGGTAIKFGRFNAKGICLQKITVPTPRPASPTAVIQAIVETLETIDPENRTKAIGMGVPGPTDRTGKVVRVAINLDDWRDVHIAEALEKMTHHPVILANDANCALVGEAWLGAGRNFRDAVLLTLGTGVGGGLMLNGKLFVGRLGTAAEMGLITVDLHGHPCNSGNQGSLEQLCSATAIKRRTGIDPSVLAAQARSGDGDALAFWATFGQDLAAGIASFLYILTPEAILIGGGVSAAMDLFLPSLWAEVEKRVLLSSREGLKILRAELGNQAGIVGAAKLAWDLLDSQPT